MSRCVVKALTYLFTLSFINDYKIKHQLESQLLYYVLPSALFIISSCYCVVL
jgi:hypothetical protein